MESNTAPPTDSMVTTPPPRWSSVPSDTQASSVLVVKGAVTDSVWAKAPSPFRTSRPSWKTAPPAGLASRPPSRSRPSFSKVHQWSGVGPVSPLVRRRWRKDAAEIRDSSSASSALRGCSAAEVRCTCSKAPGRLRAWVRQRTASSSRMADLRVESRSRPALRRSADSMMTCPGRLEARMP